MLPLGITAGLLVYLLYLASRCVFRVREGHTAALSSFGAAEHDGDSAGRLRTHGPGLHRKWPWQQVHDVPMMEQNLVLSGEEGGRVAMAEDGTVLRFDSILRYAPVESELAHYLFGLRAPLDHITGLFTCLLRNEIANFRGADGERQQGGFDVGSYAAIRRERAELNRRIEQFCQEKIGQRYGVRFNAVDLLDILPPDELADALNAVMQARTEAESHFARAEGECSQRVLSAERGVAIAEARASAIETEITRLGGYLEQLSRAGTLPLYVARRRGEVLGESRALFVRRAS